MDIRIQDVRSLDQSGESDSDSQGSSLVIDEELDSTLPPSLPDKKEKKKIYPKPPLSYSALAGLAFKNCCYGNVPVSSIYSFVIRHFPYYKNAASGWKNSIRHNLSMNRCFRRLSPENETELTKTKKGMLWTMNRDRIRYMDDVISKAVRADRAGMLASMRFPHDLECVLAGRDYEGSVQYYNSYDEESDMEQEEKIENQPKKTFIFTRYKDNVLPLVTLYSKTPTVYSKYSSKYPVVT